MSDTTAPPPVTPTVTVYDAQDLAVDPTAISDTARNIKTLAADVAAQLQNVENALSGVALGWFGGTATEVADFNDRWSAAVNGLFTTDKNAGKPGVLDMLYAGMTTAADNYDAAEAQISTSLENFGNLMAATVSVMLDPAGSTDTGGGGGSAPTSVTDDPSLPYHSTFVSETW